LQRHQLQQQEQQRPCQHRQLQPPPQGQQRQQHRCNLLLLLQAQGMLPPDLAGLLLLQVLTVHPVAAAACHLQE
jgi:hypothetical protein